MTNSQSKEQIIEARFAGRHGEFQLEASFRVPARGVTALFGPSGCGKTTILRCVAGLTKMEDGYFSLRGHVWQEGKVFLKPHHRPIGYVFQEASLFPHMSVEENLLFGEKRLSKPETGEESLLNKNEVVRLLGLTPMLNRSPSRLSGGERQRVAIGRALLSRPQILLMDEPMAALDRFAKNEILPYLELLRDELAIPVLYVSHDIAEVERLADHMVLMDKGCVRSVGPLQELLSDPALPLAQMPDASSVLAGHLSGIDEEYGIGDVSVSGTHFQVPGLTGAIGDPVRLRIEASDVALSRGMPEGSSSILNNPFARIVELQPFGDNMVTVFLTLGAEDDSAALIARITRKSFHALDLKCGDQVQALVKSVSLAG